ncbi:MAG: MurR/RpiR family transcriptional regulator [Erysipelotrichaceae bacterium]|nr:MurR/RpiR family transcriptional regulator [Erysipelotrichaceae bacterium]
MNRHDPVISMLLRYINGQYKKDMNYDIALGMLTHYYEIPHMTINDLAECCYTSNASISRFIRHLGFQSYSDFKDACEHTLKISQTDYSVEASKATKEDIEPIFGNYTKHVIDNIQFVYNNLDYQQLDRICQMVKESQDVYFLGLEFSTVLGEHFQNRLALMNKLVHIAISFEEQLEAAQNAKENAVVFIASIEGGYFYRNTEIIDILNEKHAQIIILTMNANNKLMRNAKEIILCSQSNSDTEGRISLLYIIELIIMYYYINFSHY